MIESVIASLRGGIETCDRTLATWKTRYEADPLSAFRWGADAVAAAAERQAFLEYLGFLTGEVNPNFTGDRLATAVDELTNQLMGDALNQTWRSSSMHANIAEEAHRVARAKLLRRLKGSFI